MLDALIIGAVLYGVLTLILVGGTAVYVIMGNRCNTPTTDFIVYKVGFSGIGVCLIGLILSLGKLFTQ